VEATVKILVATACVSLPLAMGLTVPAGAADWELERQREGVTVHSRPVVDSDYREYRTEFHLAADADVVWAMITDFENLPLPRIDEMKVLGRSGNQVLLYQREDCSPFRSRDYAVRLRLSDAGDERRVIGELDEGSAPATVEDVIRVTAHRRSWTVAPDGTGSVATFTFHHDPAGLPPRLYHLGVLGNMVDLRARLTEAASRR
jgi:hypothetical protein